MNARATRRPGSRGRRSSGRKFRSGKQKSGCALFLVALALAPFALGFAYRAVS